MTNEELVERLLVDFPDGISEWEPMPDGTKRNHVFKIAASKKNPLIQVNIEFVLNLEKIHGKEAIEVFITSIHEAINMAAPLARE